MSNLELKGGIIEMVVSLNDKEALHDLKSLVSRFMGNHIKETDFWDEISENEKKEVEKAIQESEDENNLVEHDEVMEKYQKWTISCQTNNN